MTVRCYTAVFFNWWVKPPKRGVNKFSGGTSLQRILQHGQFDQ